MDDSGEPRIPQRHVAGPRAGHVRGGGEGLGDVARAPGRPQTGLAARGSGKLVAGLERYYPFGRDDGKGAVS